MLSQELDTLIEHSLKRRDFLFGEKTTPEAMTKMGLEFLNAGRFSDALDFFERARNQDQIQDMKKIALERGSTFLLNRLARYDHDLVSKEDWIQAGEKAKRNGMDSMAKFAEEKIKLIEEAENEETSTEDE